MKVKFDYRGINAIEYKTRYSAGADVISQISTIIEPGETQIISLGLYVSEFDFDHSDEWLPFIKICPRSSLSKRGIICHDGTVDIDYQTHEICAILTNVGNETFRVNAGDRIAQIIILACLRSDSFAIVPQQRTGGFGSTN